MSTAHANSPADLLARLETMALMSDVGLPVGHVREQIASTIDLLIHTTRLSDGRRVISRVTSVEGLSNGRPVLRDLFQFERGVGFRQGDACQTQGHSSRRVAARVGGGP